MHARPGRPAGALIHRESRQDKEFHFQNWFGDRLAALGIRFDPPARNTYPDFRLVELAEGYEVKALAFPGREAFLATTDRARKPLVGGLTAHALVPNPPDQKSPRNGGSTSR